MPAVLPGAAPTTGSSTAWGMVPQVPDPTSTANLAITGDLANLPSLQGLAGQINQFNTQQAVNPYIANLPGYQSMVGQSSANIGNLLQGNIPPDVLRLIGQQAAERGVNIGSPGSPNTMANYLQALGLTSLGLQQQGESELTQAIGRTPVPQLFNVAQFLTTPGEEQAAQMAANMYAAAPDPTTQANELMRLFQQFMGKGGGSVGGVSGGAGGPSFPPWPAMHDATYPPATVTGGGGPATTPTPSPVSYPSPTPGVIDYTGRAAPGTATGTTPGFPGGPSPTDWTGFLGGLNNPNPMGGLNVSGQGWDSFLTGLNAPSSTGVLGGTGNEWGGFLNALNSPTSTGVLGGTGGEWDSFLNALNQPSGVGSTDFAGQDWSGFMNALNPTTAVDPWTGLTQSELDLLYGTPTTASNTASDITDPWAYYPEDFSSDYAGP